MGSRSREQRFLLYPEPIRAPSVPYKNRTRPNPTLTGWALVISAFLIDWLSFLRRIVWSNAGLSSLRSIREHLQDVEQRFDPMVVPLEVAEAVESHVEGDPLPSPSMSDKPEIPKNSVAHYRSLYLTGELTPLAVVQSVIPLIRRDTSPPGEHSAAWIEVRPELVIEAAKASTLRYKEKQSLGPLDGIPVAIKDDSDVEGYATTLGSVHKYEDPDRDGHVTDNWCVAKLKEAGAIIMGKTNMVEYGMDASGSNTTYGTPLNPYNSRYYTGGSSSGSAYAVSTGLVPIAMGSDGGGSVRIPASFCSVIGLKPTHGRLSFFPGANHANTCAVKGALAADMASLVTLYSVVSEPHPTSPFYVPSKLPSPSRFTVTSLAGGVNRHKTIGVPEAWFRRAAPGVQEICRESIKRLADRKGYEVVPIEIPFFTEGQVAHIITIVADASSALTGASGITASIRIMEGLGRATPATDYLLAQKLRHVLMQHLAWLWETHPGMVIVTPTTMCAGWPIRSALELKYGINDGNQSFAAMGYTWMGNFCGLPSISLPAGYVVPEGHPREGEVASRDTVGKVPVGIMATGEWASESALVQFGLDVEACSDEPCHPPRWVDVAELARRKPKDQ
ncbi:amidase [Durotheca rogersii]|uniref:amidase n=1 Tax=Durotheca rogersii TaxID=419775 RepID=UPI00221F34AE|nr:amidase [Durotheca rogersii]KAI5863342.1 amidase [Durotheca rogersii]